MCFCGRTKKITQKFSFFAGENAPLSGGKAFPAPDDAWGLALNTPSYICPTVDGDVSVIIKTTIKGNWTGRRLDGSTGEALLTHQQVNTGILLLCTAGRRCQ